jgi:hypothetical protein
MRFPAMVLFAAVVCIGGAAHAVCAPVGSEVVSLGEKAARFYSERSLTNAIDSEKQRVQAIGAKLGHVSRSMDCSPFPNLIGADEWRCVGKGRVCSK